MESFKEGQQVEIEIHSFSPMGINVIVNFHYEGLLYQNEVYQRLQEGQRLKGYIKKVREDDKLDISLQPIGFRNSITQFQEQILNALKANDGFLPITDKTDPETIKYQLGMSKKAFKNAIGGLYKAQIINLLPAGIKLR